MKKAIVACVVLGSCSTFACAQDNTASPGAAIDSVSTHGADSVAAAALAQADAHTLDSGEPMGGHDIAVFTAQPSAGSGVNLDAAFNARQAPRRSYSRMGPIGPGPDADGFTLGRQGNFEYLTRADVGDPFHAGTAGRANNLVYPSGKRIGSTVGYFTSANDNVSSSSSFTYDTLGGDAMSDRAWGLTVGYDYGALSLRAAHQNRHVAEVHLYDLAGNTMAAKNSIVAANLRTRWGTAYAAYSANRGWGSSPLYNPDNPYAAGVGSTSSTDSRDTLAGVAMPMTSATTFLASFIHRNDRDLANRDANMIAFGASYVMSRKTDFYAAFSRTVNTNGSGILIGGAARPTGSSAVNVGMRHAF
jgi:predicted porin